MQVPKEVATFVEEYEKINNQIKELLKDMEACKKVFTDWEEANCDAGVYIGDLFITQKPSGKEQGDGEYCDQTQHGDDWFTGTYYYPIEGSDKYVAYTYEC